MNFDHKTATELLDFIEHARKYPRLKRAHDQAMEEVEKILRPVDGPNPQPSPDERQAGQVWPEPKPNEFPTFSAEGPPAPGKDRLDLPKVNEDEVNGS